MAVSADEGVKNEKLTLFVKNIPENTTKQQLDLVFSEVGKVRRCFVVKKRQTGQFKGIGFVTFTNSEDVQSALNRTFKLGSNQLSVTFAEDKRKHDPFASQQNKVKISFTKEAKDARKLQKSRLIIRNLSFKATEEDLEKSFGKFGEILNINIPKKPDGKMRGFAFVQFKSTPDAMKAVKELNMKDIKGRTIAVDFTVAKGKFEEVCKQRKQEPVETKTKEVPKKSTKKNKDSLEEMESESSGEEEEQLPQKQLGKRKKIEEKEEAEEDTDESSGETSEEDDDEDDDDEESSDDDQFERKHLQKRLKLKDCDDDSDSEVEFGSDGEVRLVQRDKVKDTKRILKKKIIGKKNEQPHNDDSETSENDEAMEVDDEDDEEDDDEDGEEDDESEASSADEQKSDKTQKKKSTKGKTKVDSKGKKTEEDSDSDWGHTPSEGSSDEDEVKGQDDEDAEKAKRRAEMIKKEDLNRTVFISNISFDTTQKTLQEHLKKYGPYKFCLLCMDKVLNRSKGTAFAKFEEKTDAEKCIASLQAGELTLDGKVLTASSAMKREQLQQEISKKSESKKQPKDNRNMYLAREGFIRGGTSVAADVSDHDLKLRAKLEANKKKSLKNLHNFVSPTRLCIHNLPQSCDDKQLRKIFAGAVDRSAKITEARVMLNMKRLGPDGKGVSKGFGFVNFEKHEDALKALRYVNNNPEIFTDQMRPVVAFSIENKAALMVKERRLQRSRDKLKELQQMKNFTVEATTHRDVDYGKGERLAFEGLRAQTDMKSLPRRVGEKVRANPQRRNHLMRLKRLAKKAKKQPEFKKKKEKKARGPTKAQVKEKRQERQINDLIDKRRRNLKKRSE